MSYKDLKKCLFKLRYLVLSNKISRNDLIVLLDYLLEVV